jgi:predicted AAA+ superfamily ATPase
MIKRSIQEKILYSIQRNPSVALMGPRQVGKTTLAINIAEIMPSVYLDMEDRTDLEKVKDIVAFHGANRGKLIILDEIQRVPEIFTQIRSIIDKERRKGNKSSLFLFLGSASIELLKQSSESLAGRIAYIELHPIDATEFSNQNQSEISKLWTRGGFPESLLAANDFDSLEWRNNFIRTYLERDIPQIGPRIPAETLGRMWTMMAHNQGAQFNATQIGRGLDASNVTIGRYLDLMVDLLLVRRLKPWTFNVGKRLVKAPKVYVRDTGVTHALLNIGTYNDLLGHPVVGGSWEGFVIENILSVTPQRVQPFYYKTTGGAEIDLILEFGPDERWAIEIKRSSAPSLSKGFHISCEDIKATRKFVIYGGQDRFPMPNDVEAIPLFELMEMLKGL